ncbi:hypothetical protein evm_013515 [Chilo suppressalis]|nr:hypothetical protein evm_013515 [Chilo suppressalis]
MSALSAITEYGSSSDDSNSEDNEPFIKKAKLYVPSLSGVPTVSTEIHSDDPQDHDGRIRSFPHVRGNWASFVYIKYPKEDILLNFINKIEKAVNQDLQRLCHRANDFHISLSKTVVLQYHLITPFTKSLQETFSDTESFELEFSSVRIYCNENKTRTFIVLEVDYFTKKCLLQLCSKVDQVLGDFKLPLFYENPSFHTSILWFNGDKTSELAIHLEMFNALLREEIENSLRPVYKLLPATVPSASSNHNKIIMHINPKFSKQILPNQSKIYVNPIFLNNAADCRLQETRPVSSISTVNLNNQSNLALVDIQSDKSLPQPFISRTRYNLVRQNTNQPSQCHVSEKVKTTMKINKYKSIAIKKFKKDIEVPKDLQVAKQPSVVYHTSNQKFTDSALVNQTEDRSSHKATLSKPQKYYKNNYKFYKPSTVTVVTKSKSLSRSFSSDKNWRNAKLKVTKKNLKKNNIPCPLYRKYGKCLRSINGICDFLHDKKHVSVCRNFLKGICQEETCLLSHDVSAKKMPTCYFYLKGICTKDNCPYLHVKLNEKSKICQDFLKGYCEKGDNCSNRHIVNDSFTQSQNTANRSIICSRIDKKKSTSFIKSKNTNKNVKITSKNVDNNEVQNSDLSSGERRYYSEVITKSETSTPKAIKPSRCKLGTLPSYIKL